MKKFRIFVIMPFDSEFNGLYDFIKKILERDESMEVFRADNLLNQQNILKDIVESICDSDLIIADLTGLNPNVFYELGLAHGLRKNVILLTQEVDELPFDLRSYRVIQYSTHFSKVNELQDKLLQIMDELKSETISFGSPIIDWLTIKKDLAEVKEVKNEIRNSATDIQFDDQDHMQIEEDQGFLDYLADMTDSLSELTQLVNEFAEKTQEMNQGIAAKTKEIEEAWKKPSSGTASHVRKLARKTAAIMNDYGLYASDYNKKYEKQWDQFEKSVLKIVLSELIGDSQENLDAFNEFLVSLKGVKESMIIGGGQLSGMAESVSRLKGIQKDINRAASLIELETKTFIGLIEKSISTLDRVLGIGEKQIAKFSDKFSK